MMDSRRIGEGLAEKCHELLAPAFTEVFFEMGVHDGRYELILTPEGDRAKLLPLLYFRERAPKEVLKHWNILVGRQGTPGFVLRMFGQDLDASKIQVRMEKEGDDAVSLSFYSGKLCLLLEEDESRAYWMLSILLDQTIGEIAAMRYVSGIELLKNADEEGAFSMKELPGRLAEMFSETAKEMNDAKRLCGRYSAYRMEPDTSEEAELRMDIMAGMTQCFPILNEYYKNESSLMEYFQRDGIVPGFFCYPLDGFSDEEDRSGKILDFRDALEARITELAGEDAVTFIGGASGVYCGYLDFIAWDTKTLLQAAHKAFEEAPVRWAIFHTFCREEEGVLLKSDD